MKDLNGFAEFVTARSASLMRLGYLLAEDHQHAEDLVQSALLKVALRWERVSDPAAYTRRTMINEVRTRWRRRRFREQPIEWIDDPADNADTAESVVRREMFARAMRRLAVRQRAVIALRYYEDLSEAETARIMGCSVGTVKSQTHRALARLRELAPELAELRELVTMEAP